MARLGLARALLNGFKKTRKRFFRILRDGPRQDPREQSPSPPSYLSSPLKKVEDDPRNPQKPAQEGLPGEKRPNSLSVSWRQQLSTARRHIVTVIVAILFVVVVVVVFVQGRRNLSRG